MYFIIYIYWQWILSVLFTWNCFYLPLIWGGHIQFKIGINFFKLHSVLLFSVSHYFYWGNISKLLGFHPTPEGNICISNSWFYIFLSLFVINLIIVCLDIVLIIFFMLEFVEFLKSVLIFSSVWVFWAIAYMNIFFYVLSFSSLFTTLFSLSLSLCLCLFFSPTSLSSSQPPSLSLSLTHTHVFFFFLTVFVLVLICFIDLSSSSCIWCSTRAKQLLNLRIAAFQLLCFI